MKLNLLTPAGPVEGTLDRVRELLASGMRFWLDVDSPSAPDLAALGRLFPFHELNLEDCLEYSELPKVEEFPEYVFVVLHGHGFDRETQEFEHRELDLFLGKSYLVTVHQVLHHSIEAIWEQARTNPSLLEQGADALFHRIVDFLVDRYIPLLDSWEDDLEDLEDRILEGSADHLVEEILAFKRRIIGLRRSLNPQREIFRVLASHENPYISPKIRVYLRDIYDHTYRTYEELEGLRDLLTSLMDAYRSNLSLRMNEVMQKLTIVATLFMPLTFVVGLFGMNVTFPLFREGSLMPFYAIAVAMAILTLGMLAFFRRKKWL